MANAINVRLDELDPVVRDRLMRAIDDVAVERKHSGDHSRLSANSAVIQLLIEALDARGYSVRDGTAEEPLPKPASELPAVKQAAKGRKK